MLTSRKLGIIRVKVAVVNKSLLPITTDLVFGNIGYNITYTLEDKEFVPAVPPPDAPDYMDQDGPGSDKGSGEDDKDPSAAKKMRGDVELKDSNIDQGQQAGNGPEPMQVVLTPLGNYRPLAVTPPKGGFRNGGGNKSKFLDR
jgi:hypothetical protein